MLVCENVECNYGNKRIFAGVNFTAGEGTLIILHGHNGTGKTSLLHMLAGLHQPPKGAITWQGKEISRAIRDNDLGITFIGHEMMVKTELTVLENINFWADLSGDRKSIPFALKKFGLEPYARVKCDELSRGWQKRVALSRLIFSPSDLWVLDEPYNNLDHDTSKLLDSLIGEKKEVGGIIVLSSHTYVPIDSAIKLNISDFTPKPVNLALAA